jgi:WD40-like Beta Propeller Repeat
MRLKVTAVLAVTLLGAAPAAPALEHLESWRPKGISSELFESHAAFDPKTGDVYFVRSSRTFSGWRILTAHCTAQGWSAPRDPSFAGPGLEADPYFTRDGNSLYFISTRATGSTLSRDLDIWRVERKPDGTWGKPLMLPAPVSSPEAEWFPRPGPDGWLYFGSNRPGGLGRNDIWRAKQTRDGTWSVENLGPSINTPGNEYEALPSPDGRVLILNADGGMFAANASGGGWLPRKLLSKEINVNGSEIGALFSPSGHSLLFARDTGEPLSGEFFVWHITGHEAWPAPCPRESTRSGNPE